MGKVEENKQQKLRVLLDTAFELFTKNGITNTSISDITTSSGIAKGTFYLYFKDKYDIRNKLVAYESHKVLRRAYEAAIAETPQPETLDGKILLLVDYVLQQFTERPELLRLISKQLSWGVLKHEVSRPILEDDFDFAAIFHRVAASYGISRRNSELMLFMIVELTGSTCYSAMLFQEPCSLAELQPYLYESLRRIILQFSSNDT